MKFLTPLLLFLVLLALSWPQISILPLLDRDEPRFGEASREMLASGDYVVPTCNGLPRYQKPPLIYWLQSESLALFGDSEWAVRLPSALATAGTALLIFFWARRHAGATPNRFDLALTAAVLSSCTLQMMIQGRVATADATLIFFMTLTSWAGWEIIIGNRQALGIVHQILWRTVLIFAAAAGFLTKGPAAFFPLIPLLIFLPNGQTRIGIFAAALASLGLVSLWAVPAYIQTKGAYWYDEIVKHAGGAATSSMDGHGTTQVFWYLLFLSFYFLTFWISALPVSPLLLIFRRSLFGKGWLDSLNRYLLTQAGVIFLVFTFMVTKLPHYVLPAFPLLAFLFARRWIPSSSHVLVRFLPAGMALALAGVMAIGVSFTGQISPAKNLVQEALTDLSSDTHFATVEYNERSITWEMRRRVGDFQQDMSVEEALTFLHQSGTRAVFIPTELWERTKAKYQTTDRSFTVHDFAAVQVSPIRPEWREFHTRGLNSAKLVIADKTGLHWAWIDLTLVIKRAEDENESPPQ